METLIRICPNCNNNIYYKSKKSYNSFKKKNTLCRSCTVSLEIRTPESNIKRSNTLKGHAVSEKTKTKLRIKNSERIKNSYGNTFINYNKNACKIIDDYGKLHGYNFQHALNGGEFYIKELGYWVDGYDKEKNAVIEYYEKRHKWRVQKDFERETEICNFLKCDFIILWE